MASEGMRFWTAYAEPSCTPIRIAIDTGRHPVHTGLLNVLWPGQTEGLSPEEVTVAEVLSKAGYHTAMWGKWHLGDEPEHDPENQGYDYSYYGLWNGAPYMWEPAADMYKDQSPAGTAMFFDFPGSEKYKQVTGIDLKSGFYTGKKVEKRKPLDTPVTDKWLADFEAECHKQIIAFVKEKAKSDKPFFIYWATYTQQVGGVNDYQNKPFVNKANAQASFMLRHNEHVQSLLDTLKELKIAENTH